MALTGFVTKVTTIAASWLNAIDILWSTVFDEAATKAAARAALTSDLPFAVSQGGTGATTASTALSNLGGVPLAGGTMTDQLVVNRTSNGATCLTVRVTGDDTTGPGITLDHLSTSPAVNDTIGVIRFLGYDSAANNEEYVKTYALILDPTSTSEDGQYVIQTIVAGTLTTIGTFGPGYQVGAPTGGDKGAGTINSAGAIYQNNNLVASPYVATTTWTPAVTFATPGDLSVAYTTQLGYYTRLGSLVFATFIINTSTFTHTTASGGLRITGFPVTCQNVNSSDSFETAIRYSGITKAGFHSVVARIEDNATLCDFVASGSGVASSAVTTADCPTGGTLILRGTLIYGV